MVNQNDRLEQFDAYRQRDGLMVRLLPHDGKPRTADDVDDADLQCFPGHGVLVDCSELGEQWMNHCRRVLQPDYMDEYERADPEYPLVHMVRILDLALRCRLKVNMVGTTEHLN